MIECVDLIPYRLRLRRPWTSARGALGERRGWIVRAAAGDVAGFGDCAPLPAAGTEAPSLAHEALSRWRRDLVGRPLEEAVASLGGAPGPTPAARFACECALLDLSVRQSGETLRQRLVSEPLCRVAVNTMLGPVGPATAARAEPAWHAGFRVLKLKVGVDEPEIELAHLRALADRLPAGVTLRLDANGAWDMPHALQVLEGLAGLPIEALEEPLRRPRPEDLRALQTLADFPLALDESLHQPDCFDQQAGWSHPDPAALGVRRWVLKPPAQGGLCATLACAERAIAAGLEVVVTSLIESAAGVWPMLQLAAALKGQPPHGLATSPWLVADLGRPPVASSGWIDLPQEPGSGFMPTPSLKPGVLD